MSTSIGAADPRWWAAFAASYAELRASTRAAQHPDSDADHESEAD